MAFRRGIHRGKRASSEGHSWRDAKTKRGHNAGIEVCRQLHNCRHFIRISCGGGLRPPCSSTRHEAPRCLSLPQLPPADSPVTQSGTDSGIYERWRFAGKPGRKADAPKLSDAIRTLPSGAVPRKRDTRYTLVGIQHQAISNNIILG